jgi:RNA polymerase primary sigma factor
MTATGKSAEREKSSEQNATKVYLKEVSQNKLLTHQQEIELSQQIENSKKNLLNLLFEIPMCVRAFDTAIKLMVEGNQPTETIFDFEEHNQQELIDAIAQVQQNISDYLASDCKDQDLITAIAHNISELPLKLSFLDSLIQPITEIVKQTVTVSGEYMRFAASNNISREEFLANYQSVTHTRNWLTFVTNNQQVVRKYQDQLCEISSNTGLTAQELSVKITEIKKQQRLKDQAVEMMLKSNLRLVVSVAKKYINVSPTPLLDLVQEGNIGLLKAVEKFKWRLGFRFSTYATWWIKQCVLKALNEQHRVIKVPSHMTDLVKRVSRAQNEFHGSYGYDPGVPEIAQMLRVEESTVARVWTVAQGTISLETPIGTDEDQNLASVIEDVDNMNAFERIADVDAKNAIAQVLAELNPKEERVIRMRFGIGVDRECTLEDIGQALGVTRERIRQIEYKALEKLKDPNLARRMQEAFE